MQEFLDWTLGKVEADLTERTFQGIVLDNRKDMKRFCAHKFPDIEFQTAEEIINDVFIEFFKLFQQRIKKKTCLLGSGCLSDLGGGALMRRDGKRRHGFLC